jgi:hypothetical protein
MSYVIAGPGASAAASQDLAGIAAGLRTAEAAAVVSTTQVLPAAGDEVSAAVAGPFGAFGQEYQALSAQAALFHDRFVAALSAGGAAYAAAEAANVSPLQTLEDGVLAVINAPTNALLGRPLIGNGWRRRSRPDGLRQLG